MKFIVKTLSDRVLVTLFHYINYHYSLRLLEWVKGGGPYTIFRTSQTLVLTLKSRACVQLSEEVHIFLKVGQLKLPHNEILIWLTCKNLTFKNGSDADSSFFAKNRSFSYGQFLICIFFYQESNHKAYFWFQSPIIN